MPKIYSKEWCESLVELAEKHEELSVKVPAGEWQIAIEMEGDGMSPYVPAGETKHFFARVMDGKIKEYNEVNEKIVGKDLNYRITGPASIFDGMAAGLYDPIQKGLDGSLVIRGDMRLLLQNADLANLIFEIYTQSEMTEWPQGKPPYNKN